MLLACEQTQQSSDSPAITDEEAMSRRKQVRPNKFSKIATKQLSCFEHKSAMTIPPTSSNTDERHHNHCIALCVKAEPPDASECATDDDISSNASEIPGGTAFGPFDADLVDESEKGVLILQLIDDSHRTRNFKFSEAASFNWIKEISLTSDVEEANAVMTYADKSLAIKILSDLKSTESIKAYLNSQSFPTASTIPADSAVNSTQKQYVCETCSTKFINPNTLEAHRMYYCSETHPAVLLSAKRRKIAGGIEAQMQPQHATCTVEQGNDNAVAADNATLLPNGAVASTSNYSQPLRRSRNHCKSSASKSYNDCSLHDQIRFNQAANGVSVVGTMAPNVIILPCAFTSESSAAVTVIGQPQVLIPVAVPKCCHFPVSPLVLEESLLSRCVLPDDKIAVVSSGKQQPLCAESMPTPGGSGCCDEIAFTLPLHIRANPFLLTQKIPLAVSLPSTLPLFSNALRIAADRLGSVAAEPLDLSIKSRRSASESNSAVDDRAHWKSVNLSTAKLDHLSLKNSPSTEAVTSRPVQTNNHIRTTPSQPSPMPEAQKMFLCNSCGISFSSVKTLDGHQQFYCKAVVCKDQAEADNAAVTAASCQFCDTSFCTGALLNQHVKSVHSVVQSFHCMLCGFIGYSTRGIKTHLKTHHNDLKALSDKPLALDDLIKSAVIRNVTERHVDIIDQQSDHSKRPAHAQVASVKQQQLVATATAGHSCHDNNDSVDYDQTLPSKHTRRHNKKDVKSPTPAAAAAGCDSDTASCEAALSKSDEDDAEKSNSCSADVVDVESVAATTNSSIEDAFIISSDQENTKYVCKTCTYASPYKGNMKRHVTLIHKYGMAKEETKNNQIAQL